MFATSFLFIDCGIMIPQDKAFFCDEVTLIKKSSAQKSTGFLKDESRFPQTMEVSLFLSLIIFRVDFKIALGMIAGRADFRRFLADHNVTAVAALPYLDLTLGKDLRHLHIV